MKTRNGFTLIELLITMTLALVLIFVAVPSFTTFIRNSQFVTQANDLFSALSFTRSEAIKRNMPVAICATEDGGGCSGSSNWSTGWMVFTDATGTAGVYDATDELISVHEGLQGETTLTASRSSAIRFISSGFTSEYNSGSAATTTFDLTHPKCSGDQRRVITVTPYGRIHVTREAC
jgi:type IV fimbrial biogenesis protein FimT